MNAFGSFRFTTLAHEGRDLLGPLSRESVDMLLARLEGVLAPGAHPEPRVVDIGCGKGEMLVRTLERLGGRGVGIEPNPVFASEARARITRRLSVDRAAVLNTTLDGAQLPEATASLAICSGALHAFGTWRDALAALRHIVAPGGHALLGPGYWKRTPDPEYLATFGGQEDELQSLALTLATAEDARWKVLACHESTEVEWDDYEHGYASNMRAWCETHPTDPDAAPFRERIDRWTRAYERWGRDTMGFALVLAQRED